VPVIQLTIRGISQRAFHRSNNTPQFRSRHHRQVVRSNKNASETRADAQSGVCIRRGGDCCRELIDELIDHRLAVGHGDIYIHEIGTYRLHQLNDILVSSELCNQRSVRTRGR